MPLTDPPCSKGDQSKLRELLERCAATTLSSKLVAHQKGFFATLVVDAVLSLGELLPLNMIGIKKVTGGALEVCVIGRLRIHLCAYISWCGYINGDAIFLNDSLFMCRTLNLFTACRSRRRSHTPALRCSPRSILTPRFDSIVSTVIHLSDD